MAKLTADYKTFELTDKGVIDACEYAFQLFLEIKKPAIYFNSSKYHKSQRLYKIMVEIYDKDLFKPKKEDVDKVFILNDYQYELARLKDECLAYFDTFKRVDKKINDEDLNCYLKEKDSNFHFTWDDIKKACEYCYKNNIALYVENEHEKIFFPELYKCYETMWYEASNCFARYKFGMKQNIYKKLVKDGILND